MFPSTRLSFVVKIEKRACKQISVAACMNETHFTPYVRSLRETSWSVPTEADHVCIIHLYGRFGSRCWVQKWRRDLQVFPTFGNNQSRADLESTRPIFWANAKHTSDCVCLCVRISVRGERWDNSVFAKTVFHKLKLSHGDSMSVTETNKRTRKHAKALTWEYYVCWQLSAGWTYWSMNTSSLDNESLIWGHFTVINWQSIWTWCKQPTLQKLQDIPLSIW